MPIYEYECTHCHHHFDVLQKIHDAPIKECPKCGKNKAVRMISAAGFQLKGSGWYATDFKNKGKPEQKNNHSEHASSTATQFNESTTESSASKDAKSSTQGENN